MEQLPQRGSVPQIRVFHTPRLRNNLSQLRPVCRIKLPVMSPEVMAEILDCASVAARSPCSNLPVPFVRLFQHLV